MEGESNEDTNHSVSGAIEFPTRRGNVTVAENQPRPFHNLQGLLRYSTEAAAGSSRLPNEQMLPMDEESKRFLNEALQSMTVDVIAEMKKSIEAIESGSCTENEYDDVFDNILELVDKIDFANDFYKIGGFRIFKPCLNSEKIQLRWRCCELIAELCQNNPYCQEKCVAEGYLPKLVTLVNDDPSDIVKIKALYAVSCLVRESEKAQKMFVDINGFSMILKALESDCDKLKIKSSFLLSYIIPQTPQVKDDLVDIGFVVQLIRLIIVNKSAYHVLEHLLSALNALVTDNQRAEAICRNPELQLKSVLEYITENAQGKDDAREIVEYAKTIETIVFNPDNENNTEEDR